MRRYLHRPVEECQRGLQIPKPQITPGHVSQDHHQGLLSTDRLSQLQSRLAPLDKFAVVFFFRGNDTQTRESVRFDIQVLLLLRPLERIAISRCRPLWIPSEEVTGTLRQSNFRKQI